MATQVKRGAPPGVSKPAKKPRKFVPTVEDIVTDALTPIANAFWAPGNKNLKPFNPEIIEEIYSRELKDSPQINDRVILLELSSYLENYLWKHFDPEKSTTAHIMSMVVLVNEKFRQSFLNIWDTFHSRDELFTPFIMKVLSLQGSYEMSPQEKLNYVVFLIHSFQSLEDPVVRACTLRLTSPALWQTLSPAMLASQVKLFPGYKKFLKKLQAQKKKNKSAGELEKNFMPDLMSDFFGTLATIKRGSNFKTKEMKLKIAYCERFVELVIDLVAQLPTRRFFHAIVKDTHLMVLCELSDLNCLSTPASMEDDQDPPGKLFSQLLARLKFYLQFEIEDQTGAALTENDMIDSHSSSLQQLQQVAFKGFRQYLEELVALNISAIDTKEALEDHMGRLPHLELRKLCEALGLLEPLSNDKTIEPASTLRQILIHQFCRRVSQKQVVSELPLYPCEDILWDENLVPSQNYDGEGTLALPKLNLQFLTMHDYLLRNFHLYRLETTYEIREDIAQTVNTLIPRLNAAGETIFTGWGRMAVPIYQFEIKQVRKPLIGETKPAMVKANVTIDLSQFPERSRREWEDLREHDVLFLLTVQSKIKVNAKKQTPFKLDDRSEGFEWERIARDELGIQIVRGAEVKRILDEEGKEIGVWDEEGNPHVAIGNIRTYEVLLDTAQYQADMAMVLQDDATDPYTTFNLLCRRKAKENNFKAVLATIRDLMDQDVSIPEWLHDVFLGYGNPSAAQYYSLPSQMKTVRFVDTFLDEDHVRDSFSENVEFSGDTSKHDHMSYHLVTFPTGVEPNYSKLQNLLPHNQRTAIEHTPVAPEPTEKKGKKGSRKKGSAAAKKAEAAAQEKAAKAAAAAKPQATIQCELVRRPKVFGRKQPKRNTVRFTPMQVEAIKSGVNHGMTQVVGPPGTGKTDVAVQIISELYHNFPDQRILLVTHSNHALNDLFEKIMERDIDERYLLRLGRGQDFLNSDKDFSKFGRVNHMLSRRLELLDEIVTLSQSMGLEPDFGHSCETAGNFRLLHVQSRWEQFQVEIKAWKAKEESSPTDVPAKSALQQKKPAAKAPAKGKKGKKGKTEPAPVEEVDSDSDQGGEADVDMTPAVEKPALQGFAAVFPFTVFFQDLQPGTPLFSDGLENFEANMEVAWSCWRYIEEKFTELEETRPFELLRTGRDRGNFLLSKHAKIIAMTCTHAAINRPNFMGLKFQYDNLIMEEAAQILEIETFIPMMLQKEDAEFGNRLKRVVLIGDHHQLPPVIKNRAFQKFCKMDQSLFTRFIRLGMPHVELDKQGRSRPTLASLWNWRYNNLSDLPAVTTGRFIQANAGLAHEFQIINVEDYLGNGESTPQPYFYQNVGEAEYLVQMYMYLRLIGTPADKISIITTYNGQKALIRDVLEARCNHDPLFGPPAIVSTVDKFQGQQNDYILISLVRTKTAGHLRDIRRLVVAMSRARLGVYVFGRVSLFQNCFELTRTFNALLTRPTQLLLVPNERTTDGLTYNRTVDQPVESIAVNDVIHMGEIVEGMTAAAKQQWHEYTMRVQQFEAEKKRKEEEMQQKLREQRRIQEEAAREEAQAALKAKKNAEYEAQTEEYMSQREKIVEEKEQEDDEGEED